jgi:hypothetical protein
MPSMIGATMSEDEREDRRFPLLLVMMIPLLAILILALAYPAWRFYRTQADRNATQALVEALATTITMYPTRTWSWQVATATGIEFRTGRLWDLDLDGHIDGTPAVTATATSDGGFAPEVIASGYAGLMAMAKPTVAKRFFDRRQQPLDAWGNLLRIGFASGIYGKAWFGIWSAGPDGLDGTPDDIRSWP